jgi:hypothetical protein
MSPIERREELMSKVESLAPGRFEETALEIFQYQAAENFLYGKFIDLIGIDPERVGRIEEIPFLPVSFFKEFDIKSGDWQPAGVFTSSSTSGRIPSRHLVRDEGWYLRNARRGFEGFYGDISQYCVLGLLPSYLERSGSSLVVMVDDFVQQSDHPDSGFFLYNTHELVKVLERCLRSGQPALLIGVSFALLDLAEKHPIDLGETIIMETGGMKGRRRELTREELHAVLKDAFHVVSIHSEYGMTEMLSQAYSKGEGLFFPAPTMRTLAREITDPLALVGFGRTGAVNVIDLANIDTISFIATEDIGRVYADGSFEILGRLDMSDIRGCNLMVSER